MFPLRPSTIFFIVGALIHAINCFPKNKVSTDIEPSNHQNCPGVACSPPPSDATCKVSTSAGINPLLPMLGSKSDCCPVHTCSRSDGTQFTHYGLEGDGISGTSSSYSSGTGINNFPTPSPPEGFGNFGSFPTFENKPFGFSNQPSMGPFFGGSNNNRFGRNVPLQITFQTVYP